MNTRPSIVSSRNTAQHVSARTLRFLGHTARFLVLPCLILLSAGALAAAEGVVSQLSALKHTVRVDADGKTVEEFLPFATILPGDVLLCTVEYANQGAEPAGRVVVTLPVPPEMTLVAGSADHAGAEAVFSVDAGQSFGPLAQLSIKDEAGNTRPARATDVNSVRWTLVADLGPGQTGRLSYRATLR